MNKNNAFDTQNNVISTAIVSQFLTKKSLMVWRTHCWYSMHHPNDMRVYSKNRIYFIHDYVQQIRAFFLSTLLFLYVYQVNKKTDEAKKRGAKNWTGQI